MIDKIKPGKVADAEYLGWLAYYGGDYAEAARWLDLAQADAPAALWLHAKLLLREGKLDEAKKIMEKAWQTLRDPAVYTGWKGTPYNGDFSYVPWEIGGNWTLSQAASGDLGMLLLARNRFPDSLDVFTKGDLPCDAAYLAERVLTADELKEFVDKSRPVAVSRDTEAVFPPFDLRYLLGRRLVREGRYSEAAAYLPAPYNKIVGRYAKALRDAANPKFSRTDRAAAWFFAAWIARHDGMELMGTQAAPDAFEFNGAYADSDIAAERLSGKYREVSYDQTGEKSETYPIPLAPTGQELRRIAQNDIHPDMRFHYRTLAADLALKAAALMKDNTEELADVLNCAGCWVKSSDEKKAFRIYRLLAERCAETSMGKATGEQNWFFDDQYNGPACTAAMASFNAMHAEFDPNEKTRPSE